MQLARAAAARTLNNRSTPESEPEPKPEPAQQSPQPEPQPTHQVAPQPPPDAPETTAPHRPQSPHTHTRTDKQPDPAILFMRLAGIVRDCIALENRIAAGTPTKTTFGEKRRADPDRAPLRHITQHLSDHAQRLRDASAQLNEERADAPDHTMDAADHVDAIRASLTLDIQSSQHPADDHCRSPALPNPFLADLLRALDPHATYPP